MTARTFRHDWRRRKFHAFDLERNSTARRTLRLPLWGRTVEVYANANLSVYSARACNGRCRFCVEELRPAARGRTLAAQRRIEPDDTRYFAALEHTLRALAPLDPSVSITGGEPSRDPRLPRILATLARHRARKRTITTNASGLLDPHDGRPLIDWITATGIRHLNISRAHPDPARNAELMGLPDGLPPAALAEVVRRARARGTRPRLSCVLLRDGIHDLPTIRAYLAFAASLGVDNVVFRQLMAFDPRTVLAGPVVDYTRANRVPLAPLLDQISTDPRFTFTCQILGYYYYVEVWRHQCIDVVFEEADLARLEASKTARPGLIHELVFHPDAHLTSTWQPWDGILGPPAPAPDMIETSPP